MRVLGIDPGGMMGLCVGDVGGKPYPSLYEIPETPDLGMRFAMCHDRVRSMISGNAITHVFFEAPFLNFQRPDIDSITALFGFKSQILAACHRERVSVASVAVQSWRSTVLVGQWPPKSVPEKMRRRWWKAAAIAHAKSCGVETISGDLAEAFCIWKHGVQLLTPKVDLFSGVA